MEENEAYSNQCLILADQVPTETVPVYIPEALLICRANGGPV